jgi:hypothetical protein
MKYRFVTDFSWFDWSVAVDRSTHRARVIALLTRFGAESFPLAPHLRAVGASALVNEVRRK